MSIAERTKPNTQTRDGEMARQIADSSLFPERLDRCTPPHCKGNFWPLPKCEAKALCRRKMQVGRGRQKDWVQNAIQTHNSCINTPCMSRDALAHRWRAKDEPYRHNCRTAAGTNAQSKVDGAHLITYAYMHMTEAIFLIKQIAILRRLQLMVFIL